MLYRSTRGGSPLVDFTEAMLTGLAPDGGLFVPEEVPLLPENGNGGYVESVATSLRVFGAGETTDLVAEAVARFSHPEVAPLTRVGDRQVFELFWGPTLSFKDHALQVVARLLHRALEGKEAVVLGATSGDTGSAAIAACAGRPGLRVVILYPDGMVSEFQRRQMTTVPDDNVTTLAVAGNFDDCQAMVKEVFARRPGLVSVNSINWARVAAQVGYYLYLAGRVDEPFDVVVPTGNFGNAYSCWLAREMGAPIVTITIANNANNGLADLVNTGSMPPRRVVPTSAPAMDIAVPSNLERLPRPPSWEFHAGHADDAAIGDTITSVWERHGYLLDPHTAVAWRVGEGTKTELPQVVVATAHPAKFGPVVEAATGSAPRLPAGYPDPATLAERLTVIPADAEALLQVLG